MPLVRFKRNFYRDSDPTLASRSSLIVASLTMHFPTAPFLADLTDSKTNFINLHNSAVAGGRIDKAAKNVARRDLIAGLVGAIPYLEMTCGEDTVKAAETSYDIIGKPGTSPAPVPATNVAVVNGDNPGELKLRFDKVPGAYSYDYQITPDPLTDASVWQSNIGKRLRFTFTGLETGKRYWVRIVAVGKNGQTAYSEPVLTKIVQ